MAKYALLIYGDESTWGSFTPEQRDAEYQAYNEFGTWLGDKGWMRGGEELDSSDGAKQVRVRGGEVLTTDGPFAETKEQLGGFYLVECDTEDQALEAASRIPAARGGVIEVRRVVEHPEGDQGSQG